VNEIVRDLREGCRAGDAFRVAPTDKGLWAAQMQQRDYQMNVLNEDYSNRLAEIDISAGISWLQDDSPLIIKCTGASFHIAMANAPPEITDSCWRSERLRYRALNKETDGSFFQRIHNIPSLRSKNDTRILRPADKDWAEMAFGCGTGFEIQCVSDDNKDSDSLTVILILTSAAKCGDLSARRQRPGATGSNDRVTETVPHLA